MSVYIPYSMLTVMHSLPKSVLIAVVSHKCANLIKTAGSTTWLRFCNDGPVIRGACAVWEMVNWMWGCQFSVQDHLWCPCYRSAVPLHQSSFSSSQGFHPV